MQLSQIESKHTSSSEIPANHFDRNGEIEEKMGLVHAIAAELLRVHRIPMSRDDLVSCGMRGLVRAADAFVPERGTLFKTYAYTCIRGAMLDGLKAGQGHNTRGELKRMKAIAADYARQSGEQAQRNRASLVALTLRVSDEAASLLTSGRGDDHATNPELALDRAMSIHRVREAITGLPPRERQVVELLYYRCDTSFQAVAELLGVTRPHVFRIHARAIGRMRQQFAELAGE